MQFLVTGAVEEPIPGWISPGGAISLITIGIAKGLLKVIPADADIEAGLIPVDYVANATIVAGYQTALLGYVKNVLSLHFKIYLLFLQKKFGSSHLQLRTISTESS